MPQILVWKCTESGKLFEDQKDYKNHLCKLARERRALKKQAYIKDTFFDWLDDQRTNVVLNVNDIPQWLLDNQQYIMDATNAIPGNWKHFNEQFRDGDLFTHIRFDRTPKWDDSISNTHCCPKGGVRNWAQRSNREKGLNLPEGYPGWASFIHGTLERNKKYMSEYPYSALFNIVGIHTGGGGGGNDNFGYSVLIFAQEWPGAASAVAFAKLQGDTV